MANFKRKSKWKSILCGILVVAALVGACAGIAALTKKDTKTIGASAFEIGALDENGKFVENSQSIFTKEAFGCIGLRVEPNFKFGGTYDVYYYDYSGNFIEAKIGLTSIYDEDYPVAKMARVVIHPAIPEDVKEKDFKINFWEVYGYAKNLTITVNKDQDWIYETANLYDETLVEVGKGFEKFDGVGSSLVVTDVGQTGSKLTHKIGATHEIYDVYVKCDDIREFTTITVAATEGDIVTAIAVGNMMDEAQPGQWFKITFEVPEDSDYIRVRLPAESMCYIYGYND